MYDDNAYSAEKAERRKAIQSYAFFISICVCVALAAGFFWGDRDCGRTADIEIDGRINPNVASEGSLMRLPGVGLSRAKSIIMHREGILQDKAGPAFEDVNDLQAIKGIGPKTAAGIAEYLKFD